MQATRGRRVPATGHLIGLDDRGAGLVSARRGDPHVLWPEGKSVVVVALNYGPDADPRGLQAQGDRGAISVYARNRDYHDVLKKKLRVLARWTADDLNTEVKLFVDTAPVMEKPLAQKAGIGWQGKHTNLVSREFGSWLFLTELFTDLDLPPDEAGKDACGTCHACIASCPTEAITPYKLDARRCISYLTIEHEGPIPEELRAAVGNRIYGCDDCQRVCPWNKFAGAASEMALKAREAGVDGCELHAGHGYLIDGFLSPAKNQVLFHLDGVDLVARLIDGQFPNYQQVIPAGHTTRAVVEREELAKAVRLAAQHELRGLLELLGRQEDEHRREHGHEEGQLPAADGEEFQRRGHGHLSHQGR